MEENEPTARDEKEAEPELEKDESPFDETEEPLVVRPGLPPLDEIFADLDLDPDELAQLNNMNDMNDMDESLDDFDDFDDFDVIRAGDERTERWMMSCLRTWTTTTSTRRTWRSSRRRWICPRYPRG